MHLRFRMKSRLGVGWEKIEPPVEGTIAAIDDDGDYRVGLSAKQLRNLALERKTGRMNERDLKNVFALSAEELSYIQDYGSIAVEYADRIRQAKVYNAFGPMSTGSPDGIRISSALADYLGVHLEDKIKLHTDDVHMFAFLVQYR